MFSAPIVPHSAPSPGVTDVSGRDQPTMAARSPGIRAKLWQAVQAGLDGSVAPLPDRPLEPLIAEYSVTFGSTWRPVTRRKHRDDFARFTGWLEAHDRAVTRSSSQRTGGWPR